VYEITTADNKEMTLENFTDLVNDEFNSMDELQSEAIYEKIRQLKNNDGPLDDDFSIVELIFD
jgi:hypothetical protein